MQITITIPNDSVEAFSSVYERPEQIQDPKGEEGVMIDNTETKEDFLTRQFEEHGVTVCTEYKAKRRDSGEEKEADIDYELGRAEYVKKVKEDFESEVTSEKELISK